MSLGMYFVGNGGDKCEKGRGHLVVPATTFPILSHSLLLESSIKAHRASFSLFLLLLSCAPHVSSQASNLETKEHLQSKGPKHETSQGTWSPFWSLQTA